MLPPKSQKASNNEEAQLYLTNLTEKQFADPPNKNHQEEQIKEHSPNLKTFKKDFLRDKPGNLNLSSDNPLSVLGVKDRLTLETKPQELDLSSIKASFSDQSNLAYSTSNKYTFNKF